MGTLLGLSRVIDRINEIIGKAMGVAILLAVLVSATNAIIRKAFNLSSNSWLELQWYLFGAAFMLAAAYTLKQNEHIRIDIFYGPRSRADAALDRPVRPSLLPDALRRADGLDAGALRLAAFQNGDISTNAGGLMIWPARAILAAGVHPAGAFRAFPRSSRRSP